MLSPAVLIPGNAVIPRMICCTNRRRALPSSGAGAAAGRRYPPVAEVFGIFRDYFGFVTSVLDVATQLGRSSTLGRYIGCQPGSSAHLVPESFRSESGSRCKVGRSPKGES